MLFTEVEDAHVILCRRGVFQQAAVYRRGDRLYARVGNNRYIGLRRDRGTTDPKVWWDFIDVAHDFEPTIGVMMVRVPAFVPIEPKQVPKNRKEVPLTLETT